jgi:hypothetical protein
MGEVGLEAHVGVALASLVLPYAWQSSVIFFTFTSCFLHHPVDHQSGHNQICNQRKRNTPSTETAFLLQTITNFVRLELT